MVGKIIRDNIENGAKKLTVPGFGTFMRKDDGVVVFVDLVRKDDGILRELVEDHAGGYSEVEAMALVDRFIFETKNAVERTGSAVIDGFGSMTLDQKGHYQFEYSPKRRHTRENAVQERLFGEEEKKVAIGPATVERGRSGASTAKRSNKPSHRSDVIMIVAIIATVIAVVAMIFGLSAGNMPFMNR